MIEKKSVILQRRSGRSLLLSLLFVLLITSFSDAAASQIGGKLIRGVVNISTGWVEVFQGIYEVGSKNGPLTGLLYGPVFGVGMAVIRTGSGLYETATFLFPAPAEYQSTIEPEFVWENWSIFGGMERFVVRHEGPPLISDWDVSKPITKKEALR